LVSKVARPKTDTAPDVRLGQLWPYFREHRLALSVVAVLSLVTAGTSLAQPLLVSRVISAVQDSRPAGGLAAFLASSLSSGPGSMQFSRFCCNALPRVLSSPPVASSPSGSSPCPSSNTTSAAPVT